MAGRRDSGAPSSSGSLTARHTPYSYLPRKQAHLSTHVYPAHNAVPHSKPLSVSPDPAPPLRGPCSPETVHLHTSSLTHSPQHHCLEAIHPYR